MLSLVWALEIPLSCTEAQHCVYVRLMEYLIWHLYVCLEGPCQSGPSGTRRSLQPLSTPLWLLLLTRDPASRWPCAKQFGLWSLLMYHSYSYSKVPSALLGPLGAHNKYLLIKGKWVAFNTLSSTAGPAGWGCSSLPPSSSPVHPVKQQRLQERRAS